VLCLDSYDVTVPTPVIDELRDIASYDDIHGEAADAVLDSTDRLTVQSVTLDADFPLDDGENAAVTLANDTDAALLLCDEFNRIGLIHASLADTRLVTTPTLLSVFVRQGQLASGEALAILDSISAARSWDANSYVQRALTLLDES
jgi:predicted nucleic acid-binding protein